MRGFVDFIMGWWLCIPIFLGIATIAAAVLDTTRESVIYAPLLALCTATLIMTRYAIPGGPIRRRIEGISIGIGSIGSAYLWIASDLGVHPTSLELLQTLGFVVFLVATLAFIIPMIVWISKSGSDEE